MNPSPMFATIALAIPPDPVLSGMIVAITLMSVAGILLAFQGYRSRKPLVAIITIDEDSVIVNWNKNASKMFAWEPLEAIGRNISLIMPDRFHEPYLHGITLFKSTGEWPVIGRPIPMTALHRFGVEFPVTLIINVDKVAAGRYFTITVVEKK